MPRHSPITVQQRRVANELRRLREAAGLTSEQVAKELDCSRSKISRIETHRIGATPRDVRDLLTLYGVTGKRQRELIELAREGRQTRRTGWWQEYSDLPRDYAAFEADAAAIRIYSASLVPGLLQTRAYAQAVLAAIGTGVPADDIDHRVEFRMARQKVFQQKAMQLSAILDEAALRRLVGGPGVMQEQVQRLIAVTESANVTLRVLPFTVGAHAAIDGAFNILEFPNPADPAMVYLESPASESYIYDDETIGRYRGLFDHLWDVALPVPESAEFLARIAEEHREEMK